MLEQPAFGQRLRRLRVERGLTQGALAGEELSTGYLSRLESGARQPTERAVRLLADRLGIDPARFAEPEASPLAETLAVATGLGPDEAGPLLAEALADAGGQDPLTRWPALYQVAEWRRRQRARPGAGPPGGARGAERPGGDPRAADQGPDPAGPVPPVAGRGPGGRRHRPGRLPAGHRRGRRGPDRAPLSAGVPTTATALLALVSALAEAGRLPEARRHADELVDLVAGRSDTLWAEAMWTVAAVRSRQGEFGAAKELLDQALDRYDGRDNFTLWLRLRAVAADLHLVMTPPDPAAALRYVETVETYLAFAGTPALRQALTVLRARIAFQEDRTEEARGLLAGLDGAELFMPYRQQVELEVLRNQLLLLDGRSEEGMAGLRALAQHAQDGANLDLAASIWRLAAEALARPRD
ncbi:helix-turn-helix domain-containing protein [Catenulispora yoronensis]